MINSLRIGKGLQGLRAFLRVALVSLVPFLAEAGDAFNVSSDEASGIYPVGRDIVFTVKPGEGQTLSVFEKATAKILFNGAAEFPAEKTTSDGVLRLCIKPSLPGWYRCDVSLPVEGAKASVASAGALVAPDAFKPPVPEPADFDAFWSAKKALLKSAPLKFEMTPLAEAQQASVAGNEYADYECFSLRVEIPVKEIRPVMGYFARPKALKPGGSPALLYLRAAGVAGSWCIASPRGAMSQAKEYGALVLDINAHGIPNDMPKEYYERLEKNELKNYASQGHDNRDAFYFVGMYLRLLRGIDFLCSRKEWDGRHLIAVGESQGGGQALAAAGLDSRVSAVSALVPALCDFADPDVAGWPRPLGWNAKSVVMNDETKAIARAVAYCDNVFLASRSKAETQLFAGLVDTTCPASGIFAAYNNLRVKKSMVAYPHKGHNGLPREDVWMGDIGTLQKAFIKQHISSGSLHNQRQ